MIELTQLTVSNNDAIINARNKAYRLLIDLEITLNLATKIATVISEILYVVLSIQKNTELKFFFTKASGCYHTHFFFYANEAAYLKLKGRFPIIAEDVKISNDKNGFELALKIPKKNFLPNEAFLQEERERLIQQSGGEMLQEIRQKNNELIKVLKDLKSSSSLIQTEKMRALGSMTAGVAHELNNPMMGVLNYIQYAIKHTETSDRRYKPLVEAEKEINRCQEIITNLLTFSRANTQDEEQFLPIKLSVLFDRILQLLVYKIRSANIEVVKNFPNDEAAVYIKANKFQQVLLNLMVNAIDAMKQTEKRILSLVIKMVPNGIELKITDTGTGMDEETLDKIFEPFFTTKPVGQGTGLGLSVSQSIVDEHHGILKCETKPGAGTSFIIQLPNLTERP